MEPSVATLTPRRRRLREALARDGYAALLSAAPADIFYYTGCLDAGGYLVLTVAGEAWLLTSAHDEPQARGETVETVVVVWQPGEDPITRLSAELRRRGATPVAVPSLPAAAFAGLRDADLDLRPTPGLAANLRRVKDDEELAVIRQAARIVEAGMAAARAALRPGVREVEIAAEAERAMRLAGSDGRVFEAKIESGWRSAWPSTYASEKPIAAGELVLIDLGPAFRGYYGDLTRTFAIGEPSPDRRRLLELVLAAQAAALAAIRPGVTGHDVDEVARGVIRDGGHGGRFRHHTGHALGLAGDALALLAPGQRVPLLAGECVTVEPGVYVEGVGGVRIEDEVLITDDGIEIITAFDKGLDALILPS